MSHTQTLVHMKRRKPECWPFTSFFLKFLEDTSPFGGATDTLFLLLVIQSQGGSLFASFLACVILRFTSGATPAHLLTANMMAGHILYMHSAEIGYGGSNGLVL